jgi:hypothetical protein
MGGTIVNKRDIGNALEASAMAVMAVASRAGEDEQLRIFLEGYFSALGVVALALGVNVQPLDTLRARMIQARN